MRPTDIRTPRGQANEVHNEQCWRVIMDHFAFLGIRRQSLHDTHPADGIIRGAGSNEPQMLVEVKSRHDFDEEFFWRSHRGAWLISAHKLTDNIPIARGLHVPFMGAMHIVNSRVVLFKTIWMKGRLATGIEVRKCETQATINGGRKVIDNAFIPMHDAVRIAY